MRLTPPEHSIALRHGRYCGRIFWSAVEDDEIFVRIEVIKKRRQRKDKKLQRFFFSGEIDVDDPVDTNNEKLVVATIEFKMDHSKFDVNFYHPEFPKKMQESIEDLLSEGSVLLYEVENALNKK